MVGVSAAKSEMRPALAALVMFLAALSCSARCTWRGGACRSPYICIDSGFEACEMADWMCARHRTLCDCALDGRRVSLRDMFNPVCGSLRA